MTNKKERRPVDHYMQYAGMAFQLVVLMFVAAFIGDKLDEKWGGNKGYFTAGLVTFFLIAYLVKIYIELSKPSK